MGVPADKNDDTERLRQLVLKCFRVVETNRADCSLCTLSFQSITIPKLHVWVDTDLAGQLVIDLEDWEYEGSWDNAVAHLTANDLETCSAIIIAWLTGESIDTCRQLGGSDVDII